MVTWTRAKDNVKMHDNIIHFTTGNAHMDIKNHILDITKLILRKIDFYYYFNFPLNRNYNNTESINTYHTAKLRSDDVFKS